MLRAGAHAWRQRGALHRLRVLRARVRARAREGRPIDRVGVLRACACARGRARQFASGARAALALAVLTTCLVPLSAAARPLGGSVAVAPAGTDPTVTEVKPNSGPAGGGTEVTITGTGFSESSTVAFGAANATVKSVAETSIVAIAPPGAGKVHVTVTTEGVTSATSEADEFAYAPVVTRIEPKKGPETGGTEVTITGTGFVKEKSVVKFGEAAASAVEVKSGSAIRAISPAGTGKVPVTVTTEGGVSNTTVPFTYVAAPTVTEIQPAEGPEAGSTPVTITGTNFTGATAVKFGSAPATGFKVVSATSIEATSPKGTGKQPVRVTTAGGTSAEVPADVFTYLAPRPTVTSIEPSEGPTAGGTKVTIKGTGFTEGATVTIGSQATSLVIVSSEEITATTPAHAAGPQEVVVEDAGGASTGGPSFTYRAPPTVTSIEPSEGPTAGGTEVTIKGTGFVKGATVTIGSAATEVKVVSSEEIKAMTAAHEAGPQEVVVADAGGTSTAGPSFTYAGPPPPTVTAISPAEGPQAGGTAVTITGANLGGATAVHFGAASAASFKVESATSIVAISPAGSGKVDVTVTTAVGTSATSAADAFTYLAPAPEGEKHEEVGGAKPPPPPGPPPAAKCTLKPIFLTIERKHKGKKKPHVAGGALQVTVTCDQGASVTLAGRLSRVLAKKASHAKPHMKLYALGPSAAKVGKGIGVSVTLKLPLATVVALVKKAQEAVKITLTAVDAGGTSYNSVKIKQLRA
jgi:hypothetical protein